MAENVDNSLMLEILKEVRKDQQEMRTDLHEVRQDQQQMRADLQEVRKDQQEMRLELQEVRKEQRDQRTLLLKTVDAVRTLHLYAEKRFSDVEERLRAHRDDLGLMLRSELLRSLTSFQSRIESYVDRRLAEKPE
jgi:septal ring factor EnvC (AmiA/AmiB activator)